MTVTIATLPTPPSSTDPTTFDTRADAFLTALPGVVTSQNSQNVENNSINSNVNTQVNSAMTAGLANAATNATTASTGATNASGSATAASGSATAAANSATAAQNSANAASATSGLPNMTGKGGYFMRANVGATAFELVPGGTVVRDARTTNTALAAADIGKWIDFTGTFAQTFVASATLVAGWWCRVTNTGTGTITLTPNGAELIDGAATRILYPGERRLMQCDGLTIRTVEGGTIVSRRPLFATGSSAMNAGAFADKIENLIVAPSASNGNPSMLASNGTNFVSVSLASAAATSSPDGRTWTARTLPAGAPPAGRWRI